MVYSIWNNKTDELVILDGTAKECAKMMGMGEGCFRSTISKVRSGKVKKWTVKQRYKNISRFGREYKG
jgi:hypothetical protein